MAWTEPTLGQIPNITVDHFTPELHAGLQTQPDPAALEDGMVVGGGGVRAEKRCASVYPWGLPSARA